MSQQDEFESPEELMKRLERRVLIDLAWSAAFFVLGYLVGKFA